jgi:hypothetical protein
MYVFQVGSICLAYGPWVSFLVANDMSPQMLRIGHELIHPLMLLNLCHLSQIHLRSHPVTQSFTVLQET